MDEKFVELWRTSLADTRKRHQLARLLTKTLIFAETPEPFRMAIVDAILPVEYHEGQVVYRHGEEGDWMAIVLVGRLERRLERQASEIVIGDVAPGGIIGDLGLFGISPKRSFTVVALCPSQLLVLSRYSFERAISNAAISSSVSFFQDTQNMQGLMADTESFLTLDCFKNLDTDFIMAVREHSEPRLCYPGQVLMKENAYGVEMFILRAGKVKVEKNNKLVAELSSGVVLGELAVLGSDKRRTATVTCTSLCLIRVVHGDIFTEILNNFPSSKRSFDHAYVARLVAIEMQGASEDLKKLDQFYGSATPRTGAQMVQLLGASKDERRARVEAMQHKRKAMGLPKINSPRKMHGGSMHLGEASHNQMLGRTM